MRLFIAIEFSDRIKEGLNKSALLALSFCSNAYLTLKENYHMTLVFIGEVRQENLKQIKDAMDQLSGIGPFDISLTDFDVFKRNEGNILIRKAVCEDNVNKIHERLSLSLKNNGFMIDEKPLKPHITVARKAQFIVPDAMQKLNCTVNHLHQKVTGISLMLSERINGKMRYTPLHKTLL